MASANDDDSTRSGSYVSLVTFGFDHHHAALTFRTGQALA